MQLGKALSIETLAEGIEQQAELSILQAEQCDSGQGFLFAKPLDVAAAEHFLETWPGDPREAQAPAPAPGGEENAAAEAPAAQRTAEPTSPPSPTARPRQVSLDSH